MRTLSIIATVASLSFVGPVFAQSQMNDDYSANTGAATYGKSGMRDNAVMHRSSGQRHPALGAMRHPTVGNTANQRVNGG